MSSLSGSELPTAVAASPVSPSAAAPAREPAISVTGLNITYRTSIEKAPTLKSSIVRLGRRQSIVRETRALKDITFDVAHGQVMGVIGANGAGKSTLMRAVAGILPPTSGRIVVNGRASTLLALGVGFNQKLTGRENITLGGLAAGLTREQVKAKAQEIGDFAELPDDFLDMPMRTYSSGMGSRLAFAVAVHLEPDILIVDEALSAGDARFKQKAQAKMRELVADPAAGRTVLLVSHALQTVANLSSETIWLHRGELVGRGPSKQVVKDYMKFHEVNADASVMEDV